MDQVKALSGSSGLCYDYIFTLKEHLLSKGLQVFYLYIATIKSGKQREQDSKRMRKWEGEVLVKMLPVLCCSGCITKHQSLDSSNYKNSVFHHSGGYKDKVKEFTGLGSLFWACRGSSTSCVLSRRCSGTRSPNVLFFIRALVLWVLSSQKPISMIWLACGLHACMCIHTSEPTYTWTCPQQVHIHTK